MFLSISTMNTLVKKYLMAVTGLALVLFVIVHLIGNLSLFQATGNAFNAYAFSLHGWGWLMIAAEIGLGATILVHALLAIRLKLQANAARPIGYSTRSSKGSRPASAWMVVTGLVLLAFVIMHVIQFRFGPGISSGYTTSIDGEEARDLYRLVAETFHNPLFVAIYVGAMLFLAVHLRHGFWSAFQSLGTMCPKYSKLVSCAALGIAALLAIGFLLIPIWIFLDIPSRL
jgi:succinate dehydrogenase / fumarate reductase, cytochrome b subunit